MLARARAKTHVMKARPPLIKFLLTIMIAGARDAETRAPSDAIEKIFLIVDDPVEPQAGEQAAIKGHALVKAAHSYNNMCDSVNLHNRLLRHFLAGAGLSEDSSLRKTVRKRSLDRAAAR